MLANANPHAEPKPVSLAQCVREIVDVFAKHGIARGAPGDLAGFLDALDKNKLLTMKFWSVVARWSDRSGGAAPGQQLMLAAIVEAVTGRSVSEVNAAGAEFKLQVDRLSRMLAGEDVNSPVTEPPVPVTCEFDVAAMRGRAARLADAEKVVAFARREPVTQWRLKPRDGSTVAAIAGPPRPRDVGQRLILEPVLPLLDSASAKLREDPDGLPELFPTAPGNDDWRKTQPAILGAGLVLALAVLGIWAYPGHDVAASHAESASAPRVQVKRLPLAANSAKPAAKPASAPAHAPVTTAAAPHTSPTVKLVPAPPTPAAPVAPSAPASDPDTHSATLLVPQATMEHNLSSSRVPIYPQPAKAAGIEGRVLVQAVIAEDGRVVDAHVVDGDAALRQAALKSVTAWRYRPYLLNGQPAAVETTIAVDFSLN